MQNIEAGLLTKATGLELIRAFDQRELERNLMFGRHSQ
jgi:hypothetical protein